MKAHAPFGHWNTRTFVAALRSDRIEAPWMIDGAINAERFRVYVEQVLAPTLAPGDIVVMDNLASHKGKPVRRAIRPYPISCSHAAATSVSRSAGSTVTLS